MLAGVLLDLCLAPVHAVRDMPELALPIVLTWALAWRFARLYAVPLAVAVTAVIVGLSTAVPASVLAAAWPATVMVAQVCSFDAMLGIALTLFVVTLASQTLLSLGVLNATGYP